VGAGRTRRGDPGPGRQGRAQREHAGDPIARIDLNADLGESYGAWRLGDDEALLGVVTSANVACGFHAGDPATIEAAVNGAARRSVAVGAQVSYPDLPGFGRREMEMDPADLTAAVLYQIGAVDGFARSAGSPVRYVKPHGALYHRCARDPVQAGALIEAVLRYDRPLAVLTLEDSALAVGAAARGLRVFAEGFADRGYTAGGALVPRGRPGALLTDPQRAAEQALRLAATGRVASLCVHSDTPGAVRVAGAVRAALEGAAYEVTPFA
jgi:UPF0271 protein